MERNAGSISRVSAVGASRPRPHGNSLQVAAIALLTLIAACSDIPTGPEAGAKGGVKGRPAPEPAPAPEPTPTPPPVITYPNPFAGASFWVNPNSKAKQQADIWRADRPADAAQMDKIAAQSQAQWMGGWSGDILTAVNNAVTTVSATGAIPVFVAYNIPQRDCGGYSSGGTTVEGYKTWIASFAAGLAGRRAIVVLEPDALANMDCLSTTDQSTRLSLLSGAVTTLKAQGALVYLDGGHPRWKAASDQANRLLRANIGAADGFSLNVSNFLFTSDNITYGTSVSSLVGGKHFIVDTSRNGLGPTADYQWCNPSGRALGTPSTTNTGNALVDAFIWVKAPGESDGSCNGAPAAGAWWADYALGLAQRSAL